MSKADILAKLVSTGALLADGAITANEVPTLNQNTTGTAANVTGVVALANGGTGKASAPAAMANLMGYTATATAAGTTTLTNTSSYYQLFTGTSTQTIVLPVTSTLQTGWTFHICNNSTGNLTVTSSGGTQVIIVLPDTTVMATCVGTTQTNATDWEVGFTDFGTVSGTGSVVLTTSPTLTTPTLTSPTLVTPALGTPASGNFSTGTFTWPTFNQNTTGTAAGLSATLAITSGGTGATTAQTALNALAAAVTSGSYLRGNGTNVVMSAIQIADLPTVTVAKGGTGLTAIAALSIPVANTANTYTTVTPTAGQSIRINAGGTAWEAFTPSGSGTVTSVAGTGTVSGLTLTGTVTTTGSLTLGGTLAVTASNFASQTAATFLCAPAAAAGVPTFRAIVATDIPTLNQNTTGTATNATNTAITADTATATSQYITFVSATTGNVGQKVHGTGLLFVPSTGALTTSGNITAFSDERLKEQWATLPQDFVERLAQVKSGTYARKDTGVRQAGCSAQDWQQLLPETVQTGDDAEQTLSLAYGNAALVSAVELAKQVVDLRAKVAQLQQLVFKLLP